MPIFDYSHPKGKNEARCETDDYIYIDVAPKLRYACSPN